MKCLVIDDDPTDRELVLRLLKRTCPSYEAVGAKDGPDGIDLARKTQFDVILVDLNMQRMGGLDVICILRKEHAVLPILVVSGYEDEANVMAAITAGADGYLVKSDMITKLGEAIHDVVEGGGAVSAKVAQFVLRAARLARGSTPGVVPTAEGNGDKPLLSKREYDVLMGFSRGMTYTEIADHLQISVNTVRHHIRNMYQKLGVSDKAEAITRVLVKGWVPPAGNAG